MNIREFQVLVFPFRKSGNKGYEFAIFRRIRSGLWQAISGGGGNGESFIKTAVRESSEEACIPATADYFCLETVNSVPVHYFSEPTPAGRYVIDEHCFAVDCSDVEIILSAEHSEYRWVDYETARGLLKWDSNKTALWELNQRLIDNKMITADKDK
jgi:dihydroneopterin triphosphate diphosphatase